MVRLLTMRTWCVALLCTLAASPASGMRHGVPFQRADVLRGKTTCPENVDTLGDNQSNWTVVHDLDTFFACPDTKLLDFPLYTPITDPSSETYIQTASSSRGDVADLDLIDAPQAEDDRWVFQDDVTFQIRKTEAAPEADLSGQIFTAAKELRSYLAFQTLSGNRSHLYSHFGKSAVGMYIGGRVHTPSAAMAGLGAFINHVQKEGAGESLVMQYCGDGILGGTIVGIVSSTSGGVEALGEVQEAVRSWDEGKCVTGINKVGNVRDSVLWIQPPKVGGRFVLEKSLRRPSPNATSQLNSTHRPPLARSLLARSLLAGRAETACEETRVEPDDDCYLLRDRCGLTEIDDFYSYNKGLECGALMPGQRICCSPGGLESRRQKPGPDGTCATYQVASRDTCGKIATDFDITVDELEEFNDGTTWGWTGCNLLPDTVICVSEGDPPMPLPDPEAKCGPRAAQGVRDVPKGTNLADLNPCPLNA